MRKWKIRISGARVQTYESRAAAEAAVREEWDVGGLLIEESTRTNDKRRNFDIVVDGGIIGSMWEV